MEAENGTILTNARECPFCKIEIEEEEITFSFSRIFLITAALQSAGNVLGFDKALLIFFSTVIFEMLILYFVKDIFPYFPHFIFIFTVIYFLTGYNLCKKWLEEFGIFEIDDEEFSTVKKSIKLSRSVWIAAFVFNLSLWLVYLTFF
ncbi:MAG TPA: hypothetical protein VK308_09620 [Pyrinomonadaceae bacterium]|nr:hypothetical protein [Pyrinomonadaceae bacterium]